MLIRILYSILNKSNNIIMIHSNNEDPMGHLENTKTQTKEQDTEIGEENQFS